MALGLALLAVAPLLLAAPADERSQMTVPALSIFQGMLRFAEAGDNDKLQKSVTLLGPVLADHERAFGQAHNSTLVDLLSRSADRGSLLRGVRALVASDVVVLLRKLAAAPADRARTFTRTAALEWGLLEGVAIQQDLRVAQSVSARIRDIRDAVDAGDLQDAAGEASKLEGDLSSLFPMPKQGS